MKNSMNLFSLIFLITFILCQFSFCLAGDCIVINTRDSGPGSLRHAIDQANINPGPDFIIFNIPQSDSAYNGSTGVWTIRPKTSLPNIVDSDVVIMGQSQKDFIGVDTNPFGPEIELNGSLMTIPLNGLEIHSSHVEISHIIINQFSAGIHVKGADGGRVSGCYIGTDYQGMNKAGNTYGIYLADHTRHFEIVPTDLGPNVISGNPWSGITLNDSSCNNTIFGSIIGLNRTKTDTMGNGHMGGYGGIYLYAGCDSNQIVENYIGGNMVGITCSEANHNMIVNNFVGTDETWQTQLGNQSSGIRIRTFTNDAMYNLIMENRIGFNGYGGIVIDGSQAIRNTITRNSISENELLGILLNDGGNQNLSAPVIQSISNSQISGTAGPDMVIEVFQDIGSQGRFYLGTTNSDASGNWTLSVSGLNPSENITATATDSEGNTSSFSSPLAVSVEENLKEFIPKAYALYQNIPNPFNPRTTIGFQLPVSGSVHLKVYNLLGKEIIILCDEFRAMGYHKIEWNAENSGSGFYFYQIEVRDAHGVHYSEIKKCVYMK